MSFLFVRALLAFLVLPGVVAFLIPIVFFGRADRAAPFDWPGVPPLSAGIVLLLWCVRDFYAAGKGTLAPWDPPRRLVTVGLYRVSRNPMYISVLMVLSGWALGFRSQSLAGYALVVAIAFHLRVILFEEPTLARLHPAEWASYKARVPR